MKRGKVVRVEYDNIEGICGGFRVPSKNRSI